MDVREYIEIFQERENYFNYLSTCEAKKIALHLHTQKVLIAQRLLISCGCDNLVNKLHVEKPDKSWLQKMTSSHGLSIVPSSELETKRRIDCDKTAIEEFFNKHSCLLNRDPGLIFNMNETMVSSKKKFKFKFVIILPYSRVFYRI